MTVSERVTPARLVLEGTKRPAHQPTYTAAHTRPRFRVDCVCGWAATGKTWAAVEWAFGDHLINRARRADKR